MTRLICQTRATASPRRKLARDSMTKTGKYRGVDPDGLAETEADHFGNCPISGALLDMRERPAATNFPMIF
jgi:hypothetical protein